MKWNEVDGTEATTLSFVWAMIRRVGGSGLNSGKMNQTKCGSGRVVQT